MWLYAFSSVDRISTGNFAFWTCASYLRIADFIHLHGTFLTYLKILINAFLLSLHMNFPNSFIPTIKTKLPIQKLLHVRTIKTNPALHASSLLQKKPPFQRSTAPSSKRVPRKHTQYRMKIRKRCPCCTAQNLPVTRISQRTTHPLCGDTVIAKGAPSTPIGNSATQSMLLPAWMGGCVHHRWLSGVCSIPPKVDRRLDPT